MENIGKQLFTYFPTCQWRHRVKILKLFSKLFSFNLKRMFSKFSNLFFFHFSYLHDFMLHVLKYFKMWKFEVLKIFRDDFKKKLWTVSMHNLHCCMQNRTHTWSWIHLDTDLTTMKVWRKWDLMQLGENLNVRAQPCHVYCIIMIYYITVVIRLLCNIIDCTAHYVYTLFYYYIIGQGEYMYCTVYAHSMKKQGTDCHRKKLSFILC